MDTIKCKAWYEDAAGVKNETMCVMSPSLRKVRCWIKHRALDELPADRLATWEAILARFRDAVQERADWEKNERFILRTLADKRGKTWVFDLDPEYMKHVQELHARYPLGLDVVWLELTKEEMGLLLKISQL